MFVLQQDPIDVTKARNSHSALDNGALLSFEGIVRGDILKDNWVRSLLYIADAPACLAEGEKIIKEALVSFPVNDIVCIQRTGPINTGETAVWIGVWAPHRDEAFKACRFVIEEIKKRLRIWKKEFLNNGSSLWVYGTGTPVVQ